MVQSPEVARDKVWFLTLLRESHIWDRATLGTQVGGSSGGDGEGEGDGRAAEAGRVGVTSTQMSAQCMLDISLFNHSQCLTKNPCLHLIGVVHV